MAIAPIDAVITPIMAAITPGFSKAPCFGVGSAVTGTATIIGVATGVTVFDEMTWFNGGSVPYA